MANIVFDVYNAAIDIVGATGGLYLYAGLQKTTTGIQKEDFSLFDVFSVYLSRMIVHSAYYFRGLHEKKETLLTIALWFILRRYNYKTQESYKERSQLLFLTLLCMSSLSFIIIKFA
jgi:hypothetical protein